MRLWSVNLRLLDGIGLVSLWRESLLARKVLKGETNGYTNHPQLERFKQMDNPIDGINQYLELIWNEAHFRGFRFNELKLEPFKEPQFFEVNSGQIIYEISWLYHKCLKRSKQHANRLVNGDLFPLTNDMCFIRHKEDGVNSWEIKQEFPDYSKRFRNILG